MYWYTGVWVFLLDYSSLYIESVFGVFDHYACTHMYMDCLELVQTPYCESVKSIVALQFCRPMEFTVNSLFINVRRD